MIIKGKLEKPTTDMRHVDVKTSILQDRPFRDRVLKIVSDDADAAGVCATSFWRVWFSRELTNGVTRLYLSPAPMIFSVSEPD